MRVTRFQAPLLALGLLGLLGVCPLLPPAVYAQTIVSGDVAGKVIDTSGAVVVDATVTLTDDAKGTAQVLKTGSDGAFRFSLLSPGTYSVSILAPGLVGGAPHVAVSVGKISSLIITLRPASVVTEIQVDSSDQPLLQTEDANITTSFDARTIEELPVPGGDISTIPFTAPGVNLSTGAGYGGFTAFGLPATTNLFTMNGNDIMDPYLNLNNSGASNLTLGANEIADVAVVNNGYTAQYGRYPGAQVNYTTKSGSNQFHGNAQYYWNGRVLNANDWINKNQGGTRPFSNSNQWAGAVGGPIWRDKLFFYFDTEGLRYVLPGGGGTTYIPTASFMNDVIANVQSLHPAELAYYQTMASLYAKASGVGSATPVSIPTYTGESSNCGLADGMVLNGTTYGYYNISADGSTASVGATCARQFYAAVNNLNTEQLWSGRIDQVIGSSDRISYRVHHDWGVQATGTDPINSAFNANSVQPEWEGQMNESHTFSPSVINQLILSGLYYSAIFGPPNFNASVAVFPTTVSFADGIGFANVGGSNNNYPQGRNVQQYQVVDDFSWQKGKHALKFGLNLRGNKISDFRSQVNKAGLTTFNSMVDFANGEVSSDGGSTVAKSFSTKGQVPISALTYGVYAQDQWSVSDKLNLTLSLRFDHNANFKCLSNCFARLTQEFTEIAHSASTPYNQSIQTGLANAFHSTDALVLEPRAGFSYTPQGVSGRYDFRGGVGLFSDLPPGTIVDRFLVNAPNVVNFTYSGDALVDPTLTSGSAYSYLATSAAAFQNGFSSGETLAQIKSDVAAAGSSFSAPNYNSVVDKMRTPKYLEWNLEGQVQLTHHDVLDLNYVGNYAWHVIMLSNLENNFSKFGMAGLPTTAPDPRFSIVTDVTNRGRSNYHGLTSSLRHQARYGLTLTGNYTYSHALDLVSNGGLEGFNYQVSYPQQQLVPDSASRLNYGSADYDIRHSTSLQYVWQLPYKPANRFASTLASGWSVSGNLYYRTGYPMSIINSRINSRQLGSKSTSVLLAALTSGKQFSCSAKPNAADINQPVCFTADSFASVPTSSVYTYGWGNIARNSFRGPHYFNSDLQLNKETKIAERYVVKIGANFYNILNHANFGDPANNAASGTLGSMTSTVTPPSSPYGSFEGSAVSGRVVQLITSFRF